MIVARHITVIQFDGQQKTQSKYLLLDYSLIADSLFDHVKNTDILSGIKSH